MKQREEILLNSTEHISDQFHVMSIFQQDERFPVSLPKINYQQGKMHMTLAVRYKTHSQTQFC